jgi:hypothetical protein
MAISMFPVIVILWTNRLVIFITEILYENGELGTVLGPNPIMFTISFMKVQAHLCDNVLKRLKILQNRKSHLRDFGAQMDALCIVIHSR